MTHDIPWKLAQLENGQSRFTTSGTERWCQITVTGFPGSALRQAVII